MNCRCKDALSLRDHLNRSCQLLPPARSDEKDASGFREIVDVHNYREEVHGPTPGIEANVLTSGNALSTPKKSIQVVNSTREGAIPCIPEKNPNKMDNRTRIHEKSANSEANYATSSTKEPKQSVYFKSPSTGIREVSTIKEEKDSVQEVRAKPEISMDLSPTELDALLHMDMEITPEEPPNQVLQTPQKQPLNPIAEPCDICRESTNDPSNCLLRCAHCGVVVHAGCYGVPDLPQGKWQCDVGENALFHS